MEQQVQVAMDCQETIEVLAQALEIQGMRVYRSFDLRNALASLPECDCPHHGTEQCTCQYAVLLVYGDASSPVQVVAHGRDGRTWLKILKADHPSTTLREGISNALDVVLSTSGDSLANPSHLR